MESQIGREMGESGQMAAGRMRRFFHPAMGNALVSDSTTRKET